jgi:hypothetical protein
MSKTNDSSSIHNEPDAISALGYSTPADNKANTRSTASDGSEEKSRCLRLYANVRGGVTAKIRTTPSAKNRVV